MESKLNPIAEYLRDKNRQETIELLKLYYDKGFRYVVRDPEIKVLVLFSLKPKKYRKEEFWGYVNVDDPKVIPCQVIFNTDITEIRWVNRCPTLISEFIKGDEL